MSASAEIRERPGARRPAAPWGGKPGPVPAPRRGPRPRLDPHLATLLAPRSFEAEQYRVLRHALEQLRNARGVSVVAVTSPAVGDGKTTTAINLAGTFSQAAGVRALLVDGDLRRASVTQSLGLDESDDPGLAGAVLEPGFELNVLVRRREPFNLPVLPAGRCPFLPYEALRSPRVGQLFAEARSTYDFVVVDAPPVLLVPDCHALSRWVDGFLLVVAAHRTPRKLVEEALNAIEPAQVLGIVFNADDRPLGGYYKSYYGRYGEDRGNAWGAAGREPGQRAVHPRQEGRR